MRDILVAFRATPALVRHLTKASQGRYIRYLHVGQAEQMALPADVVKCSLRGIGKRLKQPLVVGLSAHCEELVSKRAA